MHLTRSDPLFGRIDQCLLIASKLTDTDATGRITGWSNPTTPDHRPLPSVAKPHIPLLVARGSANVNAYTCAGGGMIRVIS